MDRLRTSKIVIEAQSKLVALDEALGKRDTATAGWILTVLFGVIQDLQRLTEEPAPGEIDQGKISEAIHTALAIMEQVRTGIDDNDNHLASTNCSLLHGIFGDIRDLISGEKSEHRVPQEQPLPD